MTPKRLLRLWRERWGKGSQDLPDRPYVRGAVHAWLQGLPRSQFWSWPLLSALLIIVCLLYGLFAAQIEFSLNGQITFGAILVALAVLVRRFAGPLCTLLLINLGGLATISYVHWRLSKTVVFRSQTELMLSLSVCLIEFAWALYVLVRGGNLLWPIRRPSRSLPAFDGAAPTIDIVTSVTTLDEALALAHVQRLAALNWESERRHLYVVDHQRRPQITQLMAQIGATLISDAPKQANGAGSPAEPWAGHKRSNMDDVLDQGSGEFVLLLTPYARPGADLLERSIGWFVAQADLSFAYSADHEYAPRHFVGKHVPATVDQSGGIALLRRQAWREARTQSRYDPVYPTRLLHTGSALLLRDAVIVERADSRAIMYVKRALTHLELLLRFYRPIAVAMLWLLPAAVLIGEFRLVQLRADFAIAFAAPYLALLAMIDERSDPLRRWGTLRFVRELVLAIYVPMLTAVTFVRASLSNPALFARRSFDRAQTGEIEARSLSCYLLVLLNGVALCHGIAQLLTNGGLQHPGLRMGHLVFCMLAALNIALLLARQAMIHEARHIVSYLRRTKRLAVTLTFASGRTLMCRTTNFPSAQLAIELPRALTTDDSAPWTLQFRNGEVPVSITVHTITIKDRRLVVRVDAQSEPQYAQLRDQILARDRHWPSWLPHKEADLILPAWLYHRLRALPVRFIDASTRLAGALKFDQLYLLFKK